MHILPDTPHTHTHTKTSIAHLLCTLTPERGSVWIMYVHVHCIYMKKSGGPEQKGILWTAVLSLLALTSAVQHNLLWVWWCCFYVCVCVCLCVCTCACTCMYNACTYMCMCVCMYIHVCVCIITLHLRRGRVISRVYVVCVCVCD